MATSGGDAVAARRARGAPPAHRLEHCDPRAANRECKDRGDPRQPTGEAQHPALPDLAPLSQVLPPARPRIRGMDRHASWSGGPGAGIPIAGARGRRVPPRTGQQRGQRGRRGARAASWDDARRWWIIALGTLALALILPRLAIAQGLRSREMAVTLRVTAPPRARGTVEGAVIAEWVGAAVADFRVPLPTVHGGALLVAARLEQPGGTAGTLSLRSADGGLVPLREEWVSTAPTSRDGAVVLRLVSLGGAPLDAGTWRIRLRVAPTEAADGQVEQGVALIVPDRR